MRRAAAACCACLLLAGAAAEAHHSFAASYDVTRPLRLSGRLARVDWSNPHSRFVIEVRDASGRVEAWTCEGAPPTTLSRRGIRASDLHVGDAVRVEGFAARSGSRLLDLQVMQLPDGRRLDAGTEGHGR